jgi:hypothetical protein
MVIVARAPLRGLAAQRPGRSAAKPRRDGQYRVEARSPTMRTGSELNDAGFVRLQRRVGQEAAASLLTVRRFEHDLHPTAVAARGWRRCHQGQGSMPTPRDLRSGRCGRRQPKARSGRRSLRSGPLPPYLAEPRQKPARSRVDQLSAETCAWPSARPLADRHSCRDGHRRLNPSARPRCPTTGRSAAKPSRDGQYYQEARAPRSFDLPS